MNATSALEACPPALSVARVAIADIAGPGGRLATAVLHPMERATANGFSFDKRRTEYLAGRVAAKRAVGRLVPDLPPTALAIVPSTHNSRAGAPVVLGADGRPLPLAVSISHSAGWAVACATSRGEIGLDLERVEPRHPAFVDEAFNMGELHEWSHALGWGEADNRTVTLAWCCKEALLKLAGVGLRAALGGYTTRALAWCPPPLEAGGFPLQWARASVDELGDVLLGAHVDDNEAMVLAWRPPPGNAR